MPDHSTPNHRAKTLAMPRRDGEPLHPLVHSTSLKLCGAGEWLVEKHGTNMRRFWRKLHIGLDADAGQVVVAALMAKEADDGSQVSPLLDRAAGSVALLHRRRRL